MRRLAALAFLLLVAAGGDRLPASVRESLDASSRKAALSKLDAATKGAAEADLPWILLYRGELRRLEGDLKPARKDFERVAEEFPASGVRDAAVLGMAVVDAGGAASGNTLATLALIGDRGVPDTLNADRHLLLAKARAGEGASAAEVEKHLAKAEKYAEGEKDVVRRVAKAAGALRDAPTEDAPAAVSGPPDLVAIDRVRRSVAAADWEGTRAAAADFEARFADSPFLPEARYAVRRAEAGVAPKAGRVAVLLPLSGAYAIPGANLKAAVELGNQRSGGALALSFHDTAGTPDGCVREIEKAVLQEGASVIVGPLLKEEALKCAPVAQALHVPMVTFTSTEDVLAAGDQVFRAFPSTEQLVEVLLAEAYDKRGLTRFAVLHPSTPFGENAARAFEASVVARGGTISTRLAYDPEAKDFRSVAKTLGKKDYKARAGEFARLKREAEKNKQDPEKVTLPPLIDYQAIFVPDAYARVALIASALAFEEFPVGKFRPTRESTPLPLLGLNAWNNDDLARRGGVYVQDSIFVDAFDPRVDSGPMADFLSAWRERGNGDPTVVEAVGYDTSRLVAAAVAANGKDPAAALHTVTLEMPVAGTIGFGPDNQLDRAWHLLTVTRDGVRPLQPPLPTEPEPGEPPAKP